MLEIDHNNKIIRPDNIPATILILDKESGNLVLQKRPDDHLVVESTNFVSKYFRNGIFVVNSKDGEVLLTGNLNTSEAKLSLKNQYVDVQIPKGGGCVEIRGTDGSISYAEAAHFENGDLTFDDQHGGS